jgi:uncharacterized repeat protein (TIGR03803 family)
MESVWVAAFGNRIKPQNGLTSLVLLSLCVARSYLANATAEQVYDFPSLPAPLSSLVEGGDGAFYGMTAGGGSQGYGTVFRLTTNGEMTTLSSFAGTNGAWPVGGLVRASDGNFYGMTAMGGSSGSGTVFRLSTNGVLTSLVSFDEVSWPTTLPTPGLAQGSDGALYGIAPWGLFRVMLTGELTWAISFGSGGVWGPLVEVEPGVFYGANAFGGTNGYGFVFQLKSNGQITTIVSFDDANGSYPFGGLTLGRDGVLYGTTSAGGTYGWGTVFRVTTDGILTMLYSFGEDATLPDGGEPSGSMVLASDGLFYGTTATGGSNESGTVFRVTTNGILKTLASLESGGLDWARTAMVQGTDGALYGTLDSGGSNNIGSVFRATTNGGTLTTLFAFTNTDGAHPQSGLVLGGDGALYGTTPNGGAHNYGAIFRVTTNRVVTTLASFDRFGPAGYAPKGALVRGDDGALYGTTTAGGDGGGGTVFRLTTNGLLSAVAYFGFDGAAASRCAELVPGSDGAFYGTEEGAGFGDYGRVFRATTTGNLTTLASFSGTNGAQPSGALARGCDGELYGVTLQGGPGATNGALGAGTVFRVTTTGVLTTLVERAGWNSVSPGFVLGDDCAFYGITRNDTFARLMTDGQITPISSVIGYLSGDLLKGSNGVFYGCTSSNGCINVCKFWTNGWTMKIASLEPVAGTWPCGSLVPGGDGFLYGVSSDGGSQGAGSIFRVKLPDYSVRMESLSFPCRPMELLKGSFIGEPGQTYRLLRAANLNGPWELLRKVTPGPDGRGYWDEWQPLPNAAFYRVVGP